MIHRAVPVIERPVAPGRRSALLARRATLHALVAAAIAGSLPLAALAQAITLLTGRPSSVHHPLGVALGTALRKSAPPLKPSVKGTKGTAESLEELQQGLRTLARSDPLYHGRFFGGPMQRDKAYHNGTVWPWPIGAFLEAYLRVHHRSPDAVRQARVWLQPLLDHMNQACVGQIHECFEGDEPHKPVAAPAQAWSVAEVLRLAAMLNL